MTHLNGLQELSDYCIIFSKIPGFLTTPSSKFERGQKEMNENADRKYVILTSVLVPLQNIIIQNCV